MVKQNLVSPKDLDISYFIGSGKGGQNKQKNATGVQIIHRASGGMGRCSETRSQAQNRKLAFERMFKSGKFQIWLNRRLYEIRSGETIEEKVNKMLAPENLRIEVKKDGRWELYNE